MKQQEISFRAQTEATVMPDIKLIKHNDADLTIRNYEYDIRFTIQISRNQI